MTNDMESAFNNGRGWYSTICELIERLNDEPEGMSAREIDDKREEVRREIEEGPLSVMVRDGWRMPGHDQAEGPEEYEILLSTGGPALRIYGKMGEYNEPETAELQAQDWFTPWVRVPDCEESTLLAYARCFYFGE